MKIVVTGGAGFVGKRLVERLLQLDTLIGSTGKEEHIDEIVVFDVAAPSHLFPTDKRLSLVTGDIANPESIQQLIDNKTGAVFHFAGVVSGQAESDLDLGMRINIDGTRSILNACRALDTAPRLVFSSSIAVYGGDLPNIVTDDTPLTPQTSYGMEKVCCEYMINDYTRRGHVDGRSIRLPTIAIRPGRPNQGVGQWTSSLFREPLSGMETICPVSSDTVIIVMSIRRLVDAILCVHNTSGDSLGTNRGLLLPALSVSVADMAEALRRIGGEQTVKLIRWEPNEFIQKVTNSWPRKIVSARSTKLGIQADNSIDDIVQAFIDDDLYPLGLACSSVTKQK